MSRKEQTRREIANRASIEKEMAQPRMAMSARIAQMNMGTGRIPVSPKASAATRKKAIQRLAVKRKPRAS